MGRTHLCDADLAKDGGHCDNMAGILFYQGGKESLENPKVGEEVDIECPVNVREGEGDDVEGGSLFYVVGREVEKELALCDGGIVDDDGGDTDLVLNELLGRLHVVPV